MQRKKSGLAAQISRAFNQFNDDRGMRWCAWCRKERIARDGQRVKLLFKCASCIKNSK